jgi:hypothetical protein
MGTATKRTVPKDLDNEREEGKAFETRLLRGVPVGGFDEEAEFGVCCKVFIRRRRECNCDRGSIKGKEERSAREGWIWKVVDWIGRW